MPFHRERRQSAVIGIGMKESRREAALGLATGSGKTWFRACFVGRLAWSRVVSHCHGCVMTRHRRERDNRPAHYHEHGEKTQNDNQMSHCGGLFARIPDKVNRIRHHRCDTRAKFCRMVHHFGVKSGRIWCLPVTFLSFFPKIST
jgi:hypothetical protein